MALAARASTAIRTTNGLLAADWLRRARRGTIGALIAAAFVLAALLAFRVAAVQAEDLRGGIAADLRVDLDREQLGAYATGYVINNSDYRITDVRLRVEATDRSGRLLEPTFGWVYGDVLPYGGRAWFKVPAPSTAATRSVSVLSFDLVSHESP